MPGWLSRLSIWLLISAQVLISGSSIQASCWAPCWVWSRLKHTYIHTYIHCTIQCMWFLLLLLFWYSHSFATTIIINFRTFLSPQKEALYSLAVFLHLSPNFPALRNHEFTFCLYRFACYGHFMQMESYIMWPFVACVLVTHPRRLCLTQGHLCFLLRVL